MNAGGAIPIAQKTRTIYISTMYSRQAGATNFVGGGAAGFLLNDDEEEPT